MPTHRWSLLCTRATPDANNNLDIIGIIDEIQVGGLAPEVAEQGAAVPVSMMFVTLWRRANPEVPEHAQMRLVFLDPAGKEVARTNEHELGLQDHVLFRSIASVETLVIRGFGTHFIKVEFRPRGAEAWIEADRVPIIVRPQTAASGGTPTAPAAPR